MPKEETWASFMEFFCELPFNVQALIIENLHGNMKIWCIQHKSLIIDASKLTKYMAPHPSMFSYCCELKMFTKHIILLNN